MAGGLEPGAVQLLVREMCVAQAEVALGLFEEVDVGITTTTATAIRKSRGHDV